MLKILAETGRQFLMSSFLRKLIYYFRLKLRATHLLRNRVHSITARASWSAQEVPLLRH